MIFQISEGPADNDMHKARCYNVTRLPGEKSGVEKKYLQVLLGAKVCLALDCTQIRLDSISQEHVPVYPHGFIQVAPIVTGKNGSKTVEKPVSIKIEKLVYTQNELPRSQADEVLKQP